MAKIYASLIIKDVLSFDRVPDKDKEAVRKELIARNRADLIQE